MQALELEDLPEDDDEDIDFTLEGLLGPLESDVDDEVEEGVAEAHPSHGKAAAKRPQRNAGTQDTSRYAKPYLVAITYARDMYALLNP